MKDLEIKVLLKAALTDQINDREVYMKGVDASYSYEGYSVYKTSDMADHTEHTRRKQGRDTR